VGSNRVTVRQNAGNCLCLTIYHLRQHSDDRDAAPASRNGGIPQPENDWLGARPQHPDTGRKSSTPSEGDSASSMVLASPKGEWDTRCCGWVNAAEGGQLMEVAMLPCSPVKRLLHSGPAAMVVILLTGALSPPAAFAQLSDVKGSKDHPMVSRYAGSVIIGYDLRKFDEFPIPLGPNVGLSERRAAAVVKELTAKHGIPAVRLKPAGVGMLAPVAPNDSEQGRTKNRRVELVKQ